jgi:3,4-dihydroxy 2-butanone 4-phosphate synthase/GTP cyclohydrolase II
VLVRAGHTEAAVDLARLAGLYPAGVICEIMNDDGTIGAAARPHRLCATAWAKIGTIADLIAYRLRYDHLVKLVAESKVESAFGGEFVLGLRHHRRPRRTRGAGERRRRLGRPGAGARACPQHHRRRGLDGSHRETLIHKAMAIIGREGRGAIVLIRESRPDAISARLKQEAAVRASSGSSNMASAPRSCSISA